MTRYLAIALLPLVAACSGAPEAIAYRCTDGAVAASGLSGAFAAGRAAGERNAAAVGATTCEGGAK